MTTSAQATTIAAGVDGPLSLLDLAALCRAAASLCNGTEGRDHDWLTATDTVRDRVAMSTGFPELAGVELNDDARRQVAAALCRAAYGQVPADPVPVALRWQRGIVTGRAEALGRMLTKAADQLTLQASNARAAALLCVDRAALDAVDERS